MVLIKRDAIATGESKKLASQYKGPYQVDTVLNNDRLLLKDITGAERTLRKFKSVFASDLMKLWCKLTEHGTENDMCGDL